MQTFLPYEDFYECAKSLDKKRCWKQVVEAKQILNVLLSDSEKIGWKNHPAVKMWAGYTDDLICYYNIFLNYCIKVHKINVVKLKYIQTNYQTILEINNKIIGNNLIEIEKPWWLGNEKFHRSHRSRLIEKKPEFYEPLFPNDKGFNNGKYFWPDNTTKSFRII